VKTFAAFIVGLATVIGVIYAIYQGEKPSGPPSFSSSNIGNYANAGKFLSFLSQHRGQQVTLNVTCLQVSSQSACSFASDSAMAVYGSASAASCWKSNPAGPCSNGALITLGSGSLGSNGAGDYFIPQGNYVAQNQGSGSNVPEGDADYTLAASN
jgi:hypothetical protein